MMAKKTTKKRDNKIQTRDNMAIKLGGTYYYVNYGLREPDICKIRLGYDYEKQLYLFKSLSSRQVFKYGDITAASSLLFFYYSKALARFARICQEDIKDFESEKNDLMRKIKRLNVHISWVQKKKQSILGA